MFNEPGISFQDSIISYDDPRALNEKLSGGKNSSLAVLRQQLSALGIDVPDGCFVTADAYFELLEFNGIRDQLKEYQEQANQLDLNKDGDLERLQVISQESQKLIRKMEFPEEFKQQLMPYLKGFDGASLAVRSSGLKEDSDDASFAGQYETDLNVDSEKQEEVLQHIINIMASLYNLSGMTYRANYRITDEPAISIGLQRMVRSDMACSGVMMTMDAESGYENAIEISGAFGLGELVVNGTVQPDIFILDKDNVRNGIPAILSKKLGTKNKKMIFSGAGGAELTQIVDTSEEEKNHLILSDAEAKKLAEAGVIIENHYGKRMDIEWAKDGKIGKVYIVQARPITVVKKDHNILEIFSLDKTDEKPHEIITGNSVGNRIASGRVFNTEVIEYDKDPESIALKEKLRADGVDETNIALKVKLTYALKHFKEGDILVTTMTDPSWVSIMRKASAMITNGGGKACHAAIVARELKMPTVVATTYATRDLKHGQEVTVSCAGSDKGIVYEGLLPYTKDVINLDHLSKLPVKTMVNIADPDQAFSVGQLPIDGVGLLRFEFILARLRIHPKAILAYDEDPNSLPQDVREVIEKTIVGYPSAREFAIEKMTQGVAKIAAPFRDLDDQENCGRPVILRFSDFKTNEYRGLIGGSLYEPIEENPMLGFRGAFRYSHEDFIDCFEMECIAVKRVRETMGYRNVQVMIPFVRSVKELQNVLDIMKTYGLERGKDGLKVIMMCEVPANVILCKEFLELVDGFSFGSNDLTQLTLGVDRDSGIVAPAFDETNLALLKSFAKVIKCCRKAGKYIGICGQAPSDYPKFAKWLMDQDIDSMSFTTDTVMQARKDLAEALEASSIVDVGADLSSNLKAPGPGSLFDYSTKLGSDVAANDDQKLTEDVVKNALPGQFGLGG